MSEVEERRWRLYALLAVIAGCVLVLVARLVYIQLFQHEHYSSLAAGEHWQKDVVAASRGAIRDSSGSILATTVAYESLYADTGLIADPAETARRLAPAIDEPSDGLREKLSDRQSSPLLLRAGLSAEQADRVRDLHLAELRLRAEPRRVHPEGNLAAQVLGVVGVDGHGLSGLEVAFDADLAGEPGWVLAERDTGGDEIALGAREARPPIDGADVTLTLDRHVQRVVEEELAAAIAGQGASGGSAVVLDPRTGGILALASEPGLRFDDPELFDESHLALFRIPAADDLYEPGSVFKIVTLAAALDARVVEPETTILDTGSFAYGGGVVRDAVIAPPRPATMADVLARSLNVGAAYAATTLGAPRFYEYVGAFGFREPAGSGLPGEPAGLVKLPGEPGWSDFELAANSFGQGIAVTPLQLAMAVAAVANGGTRLQPYVVAAVDGPAGRRVFHPAIVRQVIRGETARKLGRMLQATVDYSEDGKLRLSRVPGYRVAGKTGTAEVPTGRGYDPRATVASFAGYAPAEDPRFVVLVKIDGPRDGAWGETAAAPVFRRIAQRLLVYYRVPPSGDRLAELRR